METNYIHEDVGGGVPLKMWTRGVPEDAAKRQLTNAARLPIVFKHIAAMPDVHFGIGATVGSVIPTLKAIIPAAVGVDIGCGMMACKTTLTAEDLPDNLAPLRSAIERAVPHGRQPRVGPADTEGRHRRPPLPNQLTSLASFARLASCRSMKYSLRPSVTRCCRPMKQKPRTGSCGSCPRPATARRPAPCRASAFARALVSRDPLLAAGSMDTCSPGAGSNQS